MHANFDPPTVPEALDSYCNDGLRCCKKKVEANYLNFDVDDSVIQKFEGRDK